MANSRHFVSWPLRRTAPARLSSRGERGNLDLQLGHSCGRCCLVEDLLLGGLDLVLRSLVEIFDVLSIEDGPCIHRNRPTSLNEFQLPQPLLQAFAPPAQRLIDRFRRRGQAALENSQREANGSCSLVVLESLGAVELLTDVLGDFLVEAGLGVGEFERYRVGDPLREEWPPVEFEQLLFDHPSHEVGNLNLVNAIPELALKAVAIEKGKEELEVFLLAVVRCGRHQAESGV